MNFCVVINITAHNIYSGKLRDSGHYVDVVRSFVCVDGKLLLVCARVACNCNIAMASFSRREKIEDDETVSM